MPRNSLVLRPLLLSTLTSFLLALASTLSAQFIPQWESNFGQYSNNQLLADKTTYSSSAYDWRLLYGNDTNMPAGTQAFAKGSGSSAFAQVTAQGNGSSRNGRFAVRSFSAIDLSSSNPSVLKGRIRYNGSGVANPDNSQTTNYMFSGKTSNDHSFQITFGFNYTAANGVSLYSNFNNLTDTTQSQSLASPALQNFDGNQWYDFTVEIMPGTGIATITVRLGGQTVWTASTDGKFQPVSVTAVEMTVVRPGGTRLRTADFADIAVGTQVPPAPQIASPLAPKDGEHVNLLQNPSFERLATSGVPDAWERRHGSASNSTNSQDRARAGGYSLKLIDNSASESVGVQSDPIAITEGATYRAEGSVFRVESTVNAAMFVRFYDANMQEIYNVGTAVNGTLNTWHNFSAEHRAPIGARYARLMCYSYQPSVGTMYFDALSFRRTENLVINPDMSQDKVGDHPTGWERINCLSQQGMVAPAPGAASNRVMMVLDNATTADAGYYMSVPVIPNQTYTLQADIYWDTGTAPALHLRYYNAAGNQVGGDVVSANKHGSWQRHSVTARAPEGATTARLIPHIGVAATGLSYFDNFDFQPTSETRYVAAQARGTGDGSTPQNAALYNNSAFWTATQSSLLQSSVKVVFLEGRYIINSDADQLLLSRIGRANHLLTLEGERPFGTVFTRNSGATTKDLNMVQTNYGLNIVFRHLHWEDDAPTRSSNSQTGYSLVVRSQSKNIVVEGCSFVGLSRNYYGAFGAHHAGTDNITVRQNEFIRSGSSTHFHMIYNSYDPSNLTIIDNYFQDSRGAYVRNRAGASKVVVKGNRFVATSSLYNQPFLEVAVFNDVNPGDEVFPPDFLYEDNVFDYKTGSSNVAINFHSSGYDPTVGGVTWAYTLNTAERNTLLSGTLAAKRNLMRNNYGVDFETTHIIRHNSYLGRHNYKVRLQTKSNYGSPSKGGNGDYNISTLVAD